jgi:hypothetical protein
VRLVHYAERALTPGCAGPTATPILAIGACALALAVLTGCGGGDRSAPVEQGGIGDALVAPINLADCTDWQQGSVEERLATIEQIRNFLGGHVAGTESSGKVLGDDEAYDLFESYCENEFARGFKLYKIYARAAAFSGLAGQ